jgi:hypothetical protein
LASGDERAGSSHFCNCQASADKPTAVTGEPLLGVSCRAGALALAVAFWFDGGLFTLPTASVFWVLLELGKEPEIDKDIRQNGCVSDNRSSPNHKSCHI